MDGAVYLNDLKHVHLNNNFTQTYEIIGSAILYEKDYWG